MRLIEVGTSGANATLSPMTWGGAGLPESLANIARLLAGSDHCRAVQAQALSKGLFLSRRNLLVSAPTNSGKTLIGYLALFAALAAGKRAILIEPLRALAQEKAQELLARQSELSRMLGVPFRVVLSTGDYRLEGETFFDSAPTGELIVATPERIEAVLRSPQGADWLSRVGAVCVDEAHLLGDTRRGATLEFLLTSLVLASAPPRLALLSATIEGLESIQRWLSPCDVIRHDVRSPQLTKCLAQLDDGEDANSSVAEWLKCALAEPHAQALVFIHQARHTTSVAKVLGEALGDLCGPAGPLTYHSQLAPHQRAAVREAFVSGQSRLVVCTSALAMGVNLPATHVVVRDLTYIGAQSPGVAELLQMMGRAGRGDQPGHALVVHKPTDQWAVDELCDALRQEVLPPLQSAFTQTRRTTSVAQQEQVALVVASLLARSGEAGSSMTGLSDFLARSWGGAALVPQLTTAVRDLDRDRLAFEHPDTHAWHLTRLGEAVVQAVLPISFGSGFGQLMRDLLSISEDDETLGRWRPLDHLLLCELLFGQTSAPKRFSAELSKQVMTWCEAHPDQVPVLFRRWIAGEKGHSAAGELFGSLRLEPEDSALHLDEWARQRGHVAMFKAIILAERSKGRSIKDIERQFGLTNLAGIEDRWRDTMLWLLAGVTKLLDVKAYYFHLKEECQADGDRIKQVKKHLQEMRWQAITLLDQLKWASPLGAFMVVARRRGGKGIGVESIRKLESAGITQIQLIANMSPAEFATVGIRKDIAKRLQTEAKRFFV